MNRNTAKVVAQIRKMLEQIIKPEAIDPWFNKPIPAFNGSTPLEMIERGDEDKVLAAIEELMIWNLS
jgi:hypothetical protein